MHQCTKKKLSYLAQYNKLRQCTKKNSITSGEIVTKKKKKDKKKEYCSEFWIFFDLCQVIVDFRYDAAQTNSTLHRSSFID